MSMDPFEKELQELPWRKPSKELRERLFSHEEETVVRGNFLSRIPLSWAALFLVSVGAATYAVWPTAEAPTIADTPMEEFKPLEIASNQSFFDFSAQADDSWSGSLTLTIEPN